MIELLDATLEAFEREAPVPPRVKPRLRFIPVTVWVAANADVLVSVAGYEVMEGKTVITDPQWLSDPKNKYKAGLTIATAPKETPEVWDKGDFFFRFLGTYTVPPAEGTHVIPRGSKIDLQYSLSGLAITVSKNGNIFVDARYDGLSSSHTIGSFRYAVKPDCITCYNPLRTICAVDASCS